MLRISERTDRQAANCLIVGFTGQLKNWCDRYLTSEERDRILTAVKADNDDNPIVGEDGHTISDVVSTLLYTITRNFIRDLAIYKDRASDFFINLKYPTLSDFRWCKDIFLSKVLQRDDCNKVYWKGKFIAGLPYSFAQKVRTNLMNENGIIPYIYIHKFYRNPPVFHKNRTIPRLLFDTLFRASFMCFLICFEDLRLQTLCRVADLSPTRSHPTPASLFSIVDSPVLYQMLLFYNCRRPLRLLMNSFFVIHTSFLLFR